MVTTTKAARYFEQLYATAVSKLEARVAQMQEGVFEPAGASAMPEVLEQKKRLIGAALVAEPKSAKPAKEAKSVGDPWGLKGLRDVRKIKCPPFELFHFERVVVDEFTYLPQASRERAVVTNGLSCGARWCLSGTPPVGSFDDVRGGGPHCRGQPLRRTLSGHRHRAAAHYHRGAGDQHVFRRSEGSRLTYVRTLI
jgi:hypothetical protein